MELGDDAERKKELEKNRAYGIPSAEDNPMKEFLEGMSTPEFIA